MKDGLSPDHWSGVLAAEQPFTHSKIIMGAIVLKWARTAGEDR